MNTGFRSVPLQKSQLSSTPTSRISCRVICEPPAASSMVRLPQFVVNSITRPFPSVKPICLRASVTRWGERGAASLSLSFSARAKKP